MADGARDDPERGAAQIHDDIGAAACVRVGRMHEGVPAAARYSIVYRSMHMRRRFRFAVRAFTKRCRRPDDIEPGTVPGAVLMAVIVVLFIVL